MVTNSREILSVVKHILLITAALTLVACGGIGVVSDRGPDKPMDVAHIPDAVPRIEPRTQAGNKSPYTLFGKTYHIIQDNRGFTQQGTASWYGYKFHGQQTSNGEIYNMYGMTAAHKTLPIPSYIRVTNTNNGRSVVVRVNDRGPFHGDRIVDLTYTAAKKLGFVDKGTAPVELAVIDPLTYQAPPQRQLPSINESVKTTNTEARAPAPEQSGGYRLPHNTFLQAGAFGSEDTAIALQQKITHLTSYPVLIQGGSGIQPLYRVRIGPIRDNWELLNLREVLQKNQFSDPHVVYD